MIHGHKRLYCPTFVDRSATALVLSHVLKINVQQRLYCHTLFRSKCSNACIGARVEDQCANLFALSHFLKRYVPQHVVCHNCLRYMNARVYCHICPRITCYIVCMVRLLEDQCATTLVRSHLFRSKCNNVCTVTLVEEQRAATLILSHYLNFEVRPPLLCHTC